MFLQCLLNVLRTLWISKFSTLCFIQIWYVTNSKFAATFTVKYFIIYFYSQSNFMTIWIMGSSQLLTFLQFIPNSFKEIQTLQNKWYSCSKTKSYCQVKKANQLLRLHKKSILNFLHYNYNNKTEIYFCSLNAPLQSIPFYNPFHNLQIHSSS